MNASPSPAKPDRILVVDDQRMTRELMRRRLEAAGFEVVTAERGLDALNLIRESPCDLVVLDVIMPGLSGLEVLQRLRTRHAQSHLPVIMVTARDAAENVVEALNLGANDYVAKPVDFDILLARIRTHLALKHATSELEAANRRLKTDLALAADIRKALLPRSLPRCDGFRICWDHRPCSDLAGDCLNVFQLDEDHIGLYLLDIRGRGISATLTSSALSHLLAPAPSEGALLWETRNRPDGPQWISPAMVAQRLNAHFHGAGLGTPTFTLHYGIFDLREHDYRYISAGHPPPMLLKADGGWSLNLPPRTKAIGEEKDPPYTERMIRLEPGQTLCLYSDGVLTAANPDGEAFGTSRLAQALKQATHDQCPRCAAHVLDQVQAWVAAPATDDLSVIALGVTPT